VKQLPFACLGNQGTENVCAVSAFHSGFNRDCASYFGVQKQADGSYVFRTWAPEALGCSLCADFTDWEEGLPMAKITDGGIYECRVQDSRFPIEGARYKFKIYGKESACYKADPFARYCEKVPQTASVVRTDFSYTFRDEEYLKRRAKRYVATEPEMAYPLNIYEMHLGSFFRHPDGRYPSYIEIADKLVPYLRQMGYTHVEFLPLFEHPRDDSLGFLATGFFAPTSRFGTPEEFAALVDRLHNAGIGVILDYAPVCFDRSEHGLAAYDSKGAFEGQKEQGAKIGVFDLSKGEVQSFLVSAALYWIGSFHIDGMRLITEQEDPDTLNILKMLVDAVTSEYPDVLMVTETPGKKLFGKAPRLALKWYRAWTKDVFDYIRLDPIARMNHPAEMNFTRSPGKKFILPISHREVALGKRSLIEKTKGSYEQKFAQLRALFLFQMTYPGKKLSFMGNEYGQFREWTFDSELEWFMLGYDMHRRLQRFVSDLNHIYLTSAPLYEKDFDPSGFERFWTGGDCIGYRRYGSDGDERIVLISFAGVDSRPLTIPVSGKYSRYRVSIDTASELYTGKPCTRQTVYEAVESKGSYSLAVPAVACSGVILEADPQSKQSSDSFN